MEYPVICLVTLLLESLPLKQGLKPMGVCRGYPVHSPFRVTSIKTRIETHTPSSSALNALNLF